MFPPLGDVFDIYEDTIPTLTKPEVLTCNKCNMTYDEFLNVYEIPLEELSYNELIAIYEELV